MKLESYVVILNYQFNMNSHLLTQEERDYFINLYREYGIKDLGIVDYGMVRLESIEIKN